MLIEYAGEAIPILAEAAGGETFAPYFAGFLPLLLNKMVRMPPLLLHLTPFLSAACPSRLILRS